MKATFPSALFAPRVSTSSRRAGQPARGSKGHPKCCRPRSGGRHAIPQPSDWPQPRSWRFAPQQLDGCIFAPKVPQLKTQHQYCLLISLCADAVVAKSLWWSGVAPGCVMCSAVPAAEDSNIWESMRDCELMYHTCLPFVSGARVHHADRA